MEKNGIKNKIKGVLGSIGREMDRWDEADRRLGTRVLQELNPPSSGRQLRENPLAFNGTVCRDYGQPGVMNKARELRAQERLARSSGGRLL
jgi:hypothetical protein